MVLLQDQLRNEMGCHDMGEAVCSKVKNRYRPHRWVALALSPCFFQYKVTYQITTYIFISKMGTVITIAPGQALLSSSYILTHFILKTILKGSYTFYQ